MQKAGPAVRHFLHPPLPGAYEDHKGLTVQGNVDYEGRDQPSNNHTATHIVFAVCRKAPGTPRVGTP